MLFYPCMGDHLVDFDSTIELVERYFMDAGAADTLHGSDTSFRGGQKRH